MTIVICTDHETQLPLINRLGTEIAAVDGLCKDPSKLHDIDISDLDALILHEDEYDLGFMQGAVRRAGIDPLGIPVVALNDALTAEQITVLAAGAAARHRAFRGAGPEHAKMQWPKLMSRRRMFAIGAPQYIGAPSIDLALCAATHGCRLCADSCPTSALKSAVGKIAYDVDTCVACGICITTCPTGATVNPTATEEQIAAQVKAMVSAADRPIGIEFRCRDAQPAALNDHWYPVEVPCTGMLSIGWLLAPLLLGAGAVAASPCRTIGCPNGNDKVVAAHLCDASTMLIELENSELRVLGEGKGPVPEPLKSAEVPPTDFRDTSIYLALASLAEVTDAVFTSVTGAVGIATIDELSCTACEQCVAVCPSNALASRQHEQTIEISFDPLLCVGCGSCVSSCPERERGAISVQQKFDLREIALGDRTLFSGLTSACEVCGGAIAPSAMLDRINSMLGPEHAGTLDLISRRCLDCR